MKASAIGKALETIRKANGGTLRPGDVVVAAADEDHPLHSQFTWDDTQAAEAYRLWQARVLIRTTVTILPSGKGTVRAYVSLQDDRGGDGYRLLVDVLRDPGLRAIALREALAELKVFEHKYHKLKELAPIFAAYRRVSAKAKQ